MKNRNVVKQDYHLVNARYKLNTSEIKFIMTAIAQINMDDDDLKEYEIKVSELEEKLQAEQNETRLKQFAKKLLSKPLEIPTNDGWMVFNWFSKIQYVRKQAKFIVRIDKDLKPYLLKLKERFVKYNLKYILPLTSNYSIRIYQLLKEYQKLQKRTFTVQELQDLLQVPKSYISSYKDFKKNVLKVAYEELKEYCDIYFEKIDYKLGTEKKQGKKVTEIVFKIKTNKDLLEKEQPSLFDNQPSIQDQLTALKGQKIYVQDKLFFFENIRQKDGKYEILAKDPAGNIVSMKTIHIEPEATLETIKEMMK